MSVDEIRRDSADVDSNCMSSVLLLLWRSYIVSCFWKAVERRAIL